MTPVFSITNEFPSCKHPSVNDRFWYIDRKFSDRAGWDDVEDGDIIAPDLPPAEVLVPIPHNEFHDNVINVDISSDTDSSREQSDSDNDSDEDVF